MTRNHPPPPANGAHVVVYRLGHLGDVALVTGVLAHLGRTRDWEFSVITRSVYAPLFTGHPNIRKVIALGPNELHASPFFSLSRTWANEFRGLSLLDLHGTLRSRLLALRWRGQVMRYPKMSLERRLFLKWKRPELSRVLLAHSITQRYYKAVDDPPPPARELRPRVYCSEQELDLAAEFLRPLFGTASAPVALHPYATHSLKTWPAQRWRELASLLDKHGVPWVSIGMGEPLFADRACDVSNTLSLRETCALLAHCRVLISGDSGPVHLASAVETPVLVLLGPTTAEWGFVPCGPDDRIYEQPMACRPCSLHGQRPCPNDGACLATISPQEVLNALSEMPPAHDLSKEHA